MTDTAHFTKEENQMPRHPKVPNSVEARRLTTATYKKWMGHTILLSWAHERPGTGPCAGTQVFEEEMLLVKIKSCKVTGRRNEGTPIELTIILEVDTDQYFAHGQINYLVLSEDGDSARVYFRTMAGMNPTPETVNIDRISS